MDTEIIDGILTFDEILEDPYYKEEFEKRVQQRLEDRESHSDVKGGTETMNEVQTQGEEKQQAPEQAVTEPQQEPAPAEHPAAEKTETEKEEETTAEPAREMTAAQFDLYNETLRRVSKTAKAGIPGRYNAFEDTEVRAAVKQQVMAGETPDVKEIAAGVIARLTSSPTPTTEQEESDTEVISLKAENALLKAGITPERIDAAKRLFLAEGGDLSKVTEFVAKYPEWQKREDGVVFSKAPPVGGKTAASHASPPVLNDFEKRVAEARKKAGLD